MFKRVFDVVVAGCVLVAVLPFVILLAVFVRFNLGGPVLFWQLRPGKEGKVFKMLKFRSMTDERDETGELLSDDKRLTKFGRWIRATSLDEIPSLFTVLKGDLSLVGPRPLLVEYLKLYSPEQARRHELRPGITGWAQVNGRNAISWEEKFKLDVWYVDNQSFWLDVKILALTAKKVLVRDGVSAEGQATMSKFTGRSKA